MRMRPYHASVSCRPHVPQVRTMISPGLHTWTKCNVGALGKRIYESHRRSVSRDGDGGIEVIFKYHHMGFGSMLTAVGSNRRPSAFSPSAITPQHTPRIGISERKRRGDPMSTRISVLSCPPASTAYRDFDACERF